jgi:hypothetical protein
MASIPEGTARRLAKAAAEMRADPVPADYDRAYMARALVLATLPHSNPGEVPQWQKRNGRFTLTLRPYRDAAGRALYPYGCIPRLLLFWIVTEATRTRQRRLDVGSSLSDFMRKVGLNPETGGGKRGDGRRLLDQMTRLFRSQLSFEEECSGPGQGMRWLDMHVAEAGEIWWSSPSPRQAALFDSYIILGEPFFRAAIAAPVPVDCRALRALRRSPMALDVYAWATYRTYTLLRTRKPHTYVPWRRLQEQLGAAYGDPANFRKAFRTALRKVVAVYPGLRCHQEPGGLRLYAGTPAIPPKARRKTGVIHGETVPVRKPAARKRSSGYPQ